MGKAEEIDNDWRAYNEDDKDRVSKGKSSPNIPHPHPPVLSSTPSAHLNKMSTTDRSKCIQEGLCFRYRQKGHVASDLTFHPDYRPSQRTPFRNPLRVQTSNTRAINYHQEARQRGDSETNDVQEGRSQQEVGERYGAADGGAPHPPTSQAQGANNRRLSASSTTTPPE